MLAVASVPGLPRSIYPFKIRCEGKVVRRCQVNVSRPCAAAQLINARNKTAYVTRLRSPLVWYFVYARAGMPYARAARTSATGRSMLGELCKVNLVNQGNFHRIKGNCNKDQGFLFTEVGRYAEDACV